VAYHVAATVLIRKWFNSEHEAKAMLNLMPKGCMMDFCGYKKDAKLKILTADISEEALKRMSENKLDPNLISQTLRIFQGVRTEILFKKYNELIQPRPTELTIKGVKKEIYFYEFSDKKLNLPTLSRAAYIFLLRYTKPDVGITTLELLEEDNINRLFDIYNQLFSNPLNRFDDMEYQHRRERVLELCDAKNHKKWEQLISKISKAFIDLLGPDLARLYIIQGGRGLAKKIVLDRKFVKGLSFRKDN
jgi:hypothetical protein